MIITDKLIELNLLPDLGVFYKLKAFLAPPLQNDKLDAKVFIKDITIFVGSQC